MRPTVTVNKVFAIVYLLLIALLGQQNTHSAIRKYSRGNNEERLNSTAYDNFGFMRWRS